DSVVPGITCPPNVTIACTASILPANTGTATSTDNCDATPTVTFNDAQTGSSCPQQFVITRTWRSQDDCGNFNTCNQIITVQDIVSPAITCPPNVTIQCTQSTLPPVTGTATSTDNCDNTPTVTFTNMVTPGACPQEYTIARTWTSTDDCGNTTTCVQMILVDDSTAPVLSCPPNVTIQCTANTLPANTGTATAIDNCDTGPVVTYNDVSITGSCINEKTITRTWTATDACGNSSSCIQIILVDDSIAPVLTCPPNMTIECTASTLPANTGSATSTDNCDVAPVVNYTDVTVAGNCAVEYTIQRTWSTSDACGNISTCLQSIFIDDSTLPAITCPPNITIECSASTLPANTGTATSTDNCDSNPTVTFTNTIIGGGCPQESVIQRLWTSTDHCGNINTCLQIITVDDSVNPVITCPIDVTIECSVSNLPPSTGTATATDNCDATPAITYTDITLGNGCPQEFHITRTWRATDDCGNFSTCVQNVTVEDNTGPLINCPSNLSISCTSNNQPPATGVATATDNCDAILSIVFSDITVAGNCPQQYVINRTWTATDDCTNSSTCLQIISVADMVNPTITCPPNITIECTESILPSNTGNPTGTDNCDGTPAITYNDITVQGSCSQARIINRTWTIADDCGNANTCVQIINVIDIEAPLITCPPNVTIECIESSSTEFTGIATAVDNCDTAPLIEFDDFTFAGPLQNGYTIQRTWLATDDCGNNMSCLQTITVENPLDPEITGLPFDTICSGETVTFTAEDQGFGPALYNWTFGSGSSPATATGIGPHTVTYTYNASNGGVGASVVLTVTLDGCPSATETVANVHVNPIPNAAINAPLTNLCYFRTRSFKPVENQIPGYSYHWIFGSFANIPTADTYGPHLVEWSQIGTYPVTLIVSSNEPGASCSDTATIQINVVSCPGNITGRVRKPDGTGIASVNLRLYPDTDLDGLPDTLPNGDLVMWIRNVFTTSAQPNPGTYSMVGLTPGQYVVVETDLPSYFSLYDIDETNDNDTVVFSDPNDNILPATVEAQEIDANNVFVDVNNPGIISGYVFEDFNLNGQPDGTEGISSVVITLHADVNQDGVADGGPLQSTLSSTIGFYTFGNLGTGDFVIVEQQPNGYNNGSDIDFTNDNDVVPNTNMVDDIIPASILNNETDAQNYFKEISICSDLVTSLQDNGPGTLRQLIDCSQSGDTIYFHANLANQIIHLSTSRIVISKNLVIHSTLNPRITIQSDVSGAFLFNAGNTVEFKNINVVSGLTGHLGAAFENYGQLTLWDIIINRNVLLPQGNYLIYNATPGVLNTKGMIQIETD
ncbi:MAG: hypothetical protein M3R25_12020, partial [Bacteroidota bacterium]|nr:hypothetical protein [Bacteroidota bacterium]